MNITGVWVGLYFVLVGEFNNELILLFQRVRHPITTDTGNRTVTMPITYHNLPIIVVVPTRTDPQDMGCTVQIYIQKKFFHV